MSAFGETRSLDRFSKRPAKPSAVHVQRNVIGALIMREIHTRFGRDNIGYLWLILEPMLLAIAVTSIHVVVGGRFERGINAAPFWITGYVPYVMFRSVVLRGETVIEANLSLLYHRMVTIFDMLIARALLEFAAAVLATLVLLSATYFLNLGGFPDRFLFILCGYLLLLWFSFALSMILCAGCELYPTISRFSHPTVYISLPLSGAFFSMQWLPDAVRGYLSWIPLTSIFEMIHMGQFHEINSNYIYIRYVVGWCMALTFIGLLMLRVVRRHIQL